MSRISLPIENIKNHYTVVVIGSGYGGGIAASRLARAGQQVCVLERGKEFFPGDFPSTLPEAAANSQYDTPKGHSGSETNLFDFHTNDDINVLVGCGLGGTSLINANVAIEADPRVFQNPAWPKALVQDLNDGMAAGYKRAREMLKPVPYPDKLPSLKKLAAHEKSAKYMKEDFYRTPIAVTFEENKDGLNHVGVEQSPCILCGDCTSGCNHTAKNTVQMNYLPDARNHGADIFTEVNIRYLEKQAGKWVVHFKATGMGREKFDASTLFVRADIVILAAGTLGSTEILLRSKQNGLTASDMLGKHFSGNGDMIAFAYNNDEKINGIGWGNRTPDADNPVGPCITSIIDTRKSSEDYKEGMCIEDGTIPGAMSAILPLLFSTASKFIGEDTDEGLLDFLGEKKRELESVFLGSAYRGAVNNTQTYLVMCHDGCGGVMTLQDDRLRITWPGIGKDEIFIKAKKRLIKATEALGGTYVPNPTWTKLLGHNLVTVHPLGGCIMAEQSSGGVVNHKGQVFASKESDEVHRGLYVLDGSVIPTSLGTNPLLTISAIAERNVALIANDHGWRINYDLPSRAPKAVLPSKVGIQFTETMVGYFSTKIKEDYQRAAELGKTEGSTFEFTVTVISNDLELMLQDERHQATLIGTVSAPALSAAALTVTEGVFNLLTEHPDEIETRLMRYDMKLSSQEGQDYYLKGFKEIRDDPGFDLWSDTTTLYITIYEGENEGGPVFGKGVLKIRAMDFMKQMRTLKVTNTSSLAQCLKYNAQFGTFFAGRLFDTFGGIFAGQNYFNPDAAPRKKRPLRASAPEVFDIKTQDQVTLRLTRYQGGSKGPVILSHGLGVSSRIFSMDTYDTNLVEYLFAHEYDVWLLDYRASIELPAAHAQFSGDVIAKYDYPRAVDAVLEITAAKSVQMVVHCYGSTTWSMSMLGGWLQGVRAAVCSQVSTHMKLPLLSRMKTGLHTPSFLAKMGIKSLNAYTAKDAKWPDKLFNEALKFYPIQKEERCNNPVCHRIAFLYGQLYEHDQLNRLTHDNLHELFGVANITSFEHLALMSRKGHLVNLQGEDSYLPHLERMAIPITFISGEENECYLPESTEITYNLLRDQNGADLYKRFVIPDYGHIDCIYGKNAVRDVYPHILNQLEETKS